MAFHSRSNSLGDNQSDPRAIVGCFSPQQVNDQVRLGSASPVFHRCVKLR